MFNLFRLLENKTLKIFSIQERHKSRHKFGGTKVCIAEKVRKYFVNPKIAKEVFNQYVNYIICSLDFKKCLMKSLFITYENNEWCHFVVRVGSPALILFYCACLVLSISFFSLLVFFWVLLLAEVLR